MPRGGYRPGAGRPKGSKTVAKLAKVIGSDPNAADVETLARTSGLTPLEYMLTVMRDETQDPDRRLSMAIAAAPYVHAKPGETLKGKKAAAQFAALTAGQGTAWGDDLRTPMLGEEADHDDHDV